MSTDSLDLFRLTGLISSNKFLVPINMNPIVLFTQHSLFRDLELGNYYGDPIFEKSCYLLSTDNWYSEDTVYRKDQKDLILKGLYKFKLSYPQVKVIFLVPLEKYRQNWSKSVDTMVFNRNALVDSKDFCVLDNHKEKEFDIVYNACLYRYKNHRLLTEGYKTALIYYICDNKHSIHYIREEDKKYSEILLDQFLYKPNINLINLKDNEYKFLGAEEINKVYNASKVGLCLSEVEGICLSSMEYLLSGIPVVNVKNDGGRDRFLDSHNSIFVNPDIEEITRAIDYLIEANLQPEDIRNYTLIQIKKEFETLIDQLKTIEELNNIDPEDFIENFKRGFKHYSVL